MMQSFKLTLFHALLTFQVILQIRICEGQQGDIINQASFNRSSIYESQLHNVLGSIVNISKPGTEVAQSDNGIAYALVTCRADISDSECQNCTRIASEDASFFFPSKGAFVWSDECFLRYDDHDFFSEFNGGGCPEEQFNPLITYPPPPPAYIPSRESLNATTVQLVLDLIDNATETSKKDAYRNGYPAYAYGSAHDAKANVTVHGLVQCSGLIGAHNCSVCLNTALLQDNSYSSVKKTYLCQNCYIRHDTYQFYEHLEGIRAPEGNSTHGDNPTLKPHHVAMIAAGGILPLLVAGVVVGLLFRRRRKSRNVSAFQSYPLDFENIISLPLYKYKELEKMTDSFNATRKIGVGGFGTVYLGYLSDGSKVAVKKLHMQELAMEEFVNEIRILSEVRHCNLVKLVGCCTEPGNLCLVYEYASNGTLYDHLHKPHAIMPLHLRMDIAIETATALAYLHSSVDPPIIHRDVKSRNILLDDNMKVKVADFGISKILCSGADHATTAPKGTFGYLDPDYYNTFQLTDKSDVYSFGVVLFELITAKRAVDESRDTDEMGLANFCINRIQDGTLLTVADANMDFEEKEIAATLIPAMADLAWLCTSAKKEDRPSMTSVLSQLCELRENYLLENGR